MHFFTRGESQIFTQPRLKIDLNRLIQNYKKLAEIIAPATPSAVVKDDAYGLGAPQVAKALYEQAECRNFWVAHALEGARIAQVVPEANIFVLQGIGEDSRNLFEEYHLIPVIASPEMLAFWKQNPLKDIKPVIQVETGLNRLGFRLGELKKLSKSDLKIFGMVLSHLACADEKDHFMNAHQRKIFFGFAGNIVSLRRRVFGCGFLLRHGAFGRGHVWH